MSSSDWPIPLCFITIARSTAAGGKKSPPAGWSRTSTRCAPCASHPRHSQEPARRRLVPGQGPPTMRADSHTERWRSFSDFPQWRPRMLSRAANSNMGSSTARASTCSAYTRERRRTRARLRRCSSTRPSARMSHVVRLGPAPVRRDCRSFGGLHGGRATCTRAEQRSNGRLDRQFYARLCTAPRRPPLPHPAGHQFYLRSA
jgi:hypothetical protein